MTHGGKFSFGRNWQKYLDEMPAGAETRMGAYIENWVGSLNGRRVVDIGSGQGLASMSAHLAGAGVISFDSDPHSVVATGRLWSIAGQPHDWSVRQGSILDVGFVQELGTFDVVMSWGVLHHTGNLWTALDAAAELVAPGGLLWIALYHRTATSRRSLRIKKLYAALPVGAQAAFRGAYSAAKVMKHLLAYRSLSRLRDYDVERGMSWRRDIEDWLGGLPYEVSGPGEVIARLRPRGFILERLEDAVIEGRNDVYLFRRAQ